MTEADLALLRSNDGKVVRIICHDSEVITAKVLFVSETERDLIYELIATTKESRYEKHDEQPVYLIRFEDIEHVEV